MPVERIQVSVSQLCDLLAIDPTRFVGIEGPHGPSTSVTILVEDAMQTVGTCPPLSDNTKRKPKKR